MKFCKIKIKNKIYNKKKKNTHAKKRNVKKEMEKNEMENGLTMYDFVFIVHPLPPADHHLNR